jgi:hypothetical protein
MPPISVLTHHVELLLFTAVGTDDLVESKRGRFPVAVTEPMPSGHRATATPADEKIEKNPSMRSATT